MKNLFSRIFLYSAISVFLSVSAGSCVQTSVSDAVSRYAALLLSIKKYPPVFVVYEKSEYTLIKDTEQSVIPGVSDDIAECTVTPTLPVGLSLNSKNCVISGIPATAQKAAEYKVTALASTGKNFSTALKIAIRLKPLGLYYSGNPFTFFKNSLISGAVPSVSGTPDSYSVSPTLPAGISINGLTGELAGTPVLVSAPGAYKVTATNAEESITADISIRVNFMRTWTEAEPILSSQSSLGLSTTETVASFANYPGSSKWFGGVLAPNGKIYGIPRSATSVLVIDPNSNSAYTFGSIGSAAVQKWFGGVLAPNGKIYGIPNSATSVLVIDPETDTATTFGSVGTGSVDWVGGILAPNGKIYCIPANSTSVLVIDPSNDTTYTFGALGAGTKWYGGVLAPNGKIYGIPYSSGSVLVIDPSNDTTYTFGALGGGTKWRGGVLALSGNIYGIPYNSANVLKINPNTDTASVFPSGGTGGGPGGDWQGGAVAPNGMIYAAPHTNASVLVINPNNDSVSNVGGFGGSFRWTGAVLAPNNRIYAIPANMVTVLAVDTKSVGVWPADLYMSPYFNKF